MKLFILACLFLFVSIINPENEIQHNNSGDNKQIEWFPASLVQSKDELIKTIGNPEIIDSKYGKALRFNGSIDGLLIDQMPLSGLSQFTIEVLFYPKSEGNFEQRLFHCGEISGPRVLLETRSTATDWYFDAFINSGDQKKTLIDSTLIHPLDQWYHLAYVVDQGKLATYVNHMKELEYQIPMTPIPDGKTSIGVRQDERSWFKGAIYKIKITPNALTPENFMDF